MRRGLIFAVGFRLLNAARVAVADVLVADADDALCAWCAVELAPLSFRYVADGLQLLVFAVRQKGGVLRAQRRVGAACAA